MSTDLRAELARLLRTIVADAALAATAVVVRSDNDNNLVERVMDDARAVRDVLDPWREGPPAESGVYACEVEGDPGQPPVAQAVRWDAALGVLYGHGWRQNGWLTVDGRPARCRPLDVSGP